MKYKYIRVNNYLLKINNVVAAFEFIGDDEKGDKFFELQVHYDDGKQCAIRFKNQIEVIQAVNKLDKALGAK